MDVIIFNKYERKGDRMDTLNTMIKELEKKNSSNHTYALTEIDSIAKKILKFSGVYAKKTSIPIVKIAKQFDFKTYKETLQDGLSGDIYINGETYNEFGHNRVILVNKNDHIFQQRFVIAHELAHFLFDFLGKAKYLDTNIKFSDTYFKNRHETPEEKRANRFAASILMPKNTFIEQYKIAMMESGNWLYAIVYLSQFFETPVDSIEKRIMEVIS